MARVLDLARRAAASDATVLITGESGTGKERVARFIHAHSPRGARPFMAINCGALPESLLESELFGHVRGAFTGAAADKEGLFEAASGGTLFLDEIGETPLSMQVRLLRAIQERRVRPVGAVKDRKVEIRIIAATNRELENMVAEGAFRKDLYYRLRVIPLEIPPLRRRKEDIPHLARTFIAHACRENHCGPCRLSPEVLDQLQAYDWPGNIRELENTIDRAVILAERRPRIEIQDLPPDVRGARVQPPADTGAIMTLADVERDHILATLDRLGGHRKNTAKALGIGENTLWRKLKRWGMVRHRRAGSQQTEEP